MGSLRPRLFPLHLACLALLPCASADAALEKYRLRRTLMLNYNVAFEPAQPNPDFAPRCQDANDAVAPQLSARVDACHGVAVIDATALAPVLRRLRFLEDWTVTNMIIPLGAPIFRSENKRTSTEQLTTGQGTSAAGSTIRWGVVSGWTVSGARWCNTSVPVICSLGMYMDEATIDPPLDSAFFDLGTWTFHGTGFTGSPFVHAYFLTSPGNSMTLYSGLRVFEEPIPALPLLGLIGLAGALVTGGVAEFRRGRAD